jgi:hypothetical protein
MGEERTSRVNEDATELARRIVGLLAAVDSRRAVMPDEIALWLGSGQKRTKTSMELAISNDWIERKEQGVILLKAGKQMLRRSP